MTTTGTVSDDVTPTPRKSYIIRDGDRQTSRFSTISPDEPDRIHLSDAKEVIGMLNFDKTWPFVIAPAISGVMASAVGLYTMKFLRKTLVMGQRGVRSSYIMAFGVPATLSYLGHRQAVSSKITAAENVGKCTVCQQVRSGVFQMVTGVIYPFLLPHAGLLPIMHYMGNKSFRIPDVRKEPLGVVKFFAPIWTNKRPAWRQQLFFVTAGQFIVAMGLAYIQQEYFFQYVLPVMVAGKLDYEDSTETENMRAS